MLEFFMFSLAHVAIQPSNINSSSSISKRDLIIQTAQSRPTDPKFKTSTENNFHFVDPVYYSIMSSIMKFFAFNYTLHSSNITNSSSTPSKIRRLRSGDRILSSAAMERVKASSSVFGVLIEVWLKSNELPSPSTSSMLMSSPSFAHTASKVSFFIIFYEVSF